MSIFDVRDIVEVIFSNLKCFEIAKLAYVNKTCYLEYKKTYHVKYNEDVISFNTLYQNYIRVINFMGSITYRKWSFRYDYYGPDIHAHFPQLFDEATQNIKDMNQYWYVLLHDNVKMDTLFRLNSYVYEYLKPHEYVGNDEGTTMRISM